MEPTTTTINLGPPPGVLKDPARVQAAIKAQDRARETLLMHASEFARMLDKFPSMRRAVAAAIAELNGWEPEEADETYLATMVEERRSWDNASEELMRAIAGR